MSTLTEVANKLIEETNCGTAQAIKALDESGGDYEKALQILRVEMNSSDTEEEKQENKTRAGGEKEEFTVKGEDILEIIKLLIREGNVTKITVKRKGEILINIPVNAATIGAILAPYLAILGSIVALATDCTLVVERKGDVVVDLNKTIKNAESKVGKVIKDILNKE